MNAGRKPKGARAGVSHLLRERFARLLPIHVTMRMARHVFNLRSRRSFSIVARAIAAAAERFGMRIVQFAVLGNHVHLVVEAESNEALSRGMQGQFSSKHYMAVEAVSAYWHFVDIVWVALFAVIYLLK